MKVTAIHAKITEQDKERFVNEVTRKMMEIAQKNKLQNKMLTKPNNGVIILPQNKGEV